MSNSADVVLQNVTLRFGGSQSLPVFTNFSLTVRRGSFTVLVGPSGCGKSTLLNIIDGLVRPTSAETVTVLGQDIYGSTDYQKNWAYVFQHARLLPWRTLRGNAEIGLRGLRLQDPARWEELIHKYFGITELSDYQDYYPHQVSGGMQQRAAIVRAWVNEPQILLMDEPFSHLDEITAAELRRGLIALWSQDKERRTVIFVTHDISEAVELGTRVVMLTQRPASVCHDEEIPLPYPRTEAEGDVFEFEKKLRQIFAERARRPI